MTARDDGVSRSTSAAVDLARSAASLVRESLAASLATVESGTGDPYVSLVEVATLPDGRPVMLLSRLARHTRNLAADPRAALLFDRRVSTEGGLALERATVMGIARQADDDALPRRRFLARHPAASAYAGFGDFSMWRIDAASVHIVAGFGRIGEVPWSSCGGEEESPLDAVLARSETRLVEALNARLAAQSTQGPCEGLADARVSGIDRWGVDVITRDQERLRGIRLTYASRAATEGEAVEEAWKCLYYWLRRSTGTAYPGQPDETEPSAGSRG
jgi:heme iron utilization protein